MKLPFHLAAVLGALIVLFGCQITPDSGQSTDAGKKGADEAQKLVPKVKRGTLEGLHLGVSRGKVTEKLGPADKVEKIGAWQIAHHKYILAEKISYRRGGGGYYTSSGNLIADILIITVGSALSAALSYASEYILADAKIAYDETGNIVFTGGSVPDAEILKRATEGDSAAQFKLQAKALGSTQWAWLCRSATSGYVDAKIEIARIHALGYPGITLPVSQAWYQAAVEAGHSSAGMYEFEIVHLIGPLGTKPGRELTPDAVCDPALPPTRLLRGEAARVGVEDCEYVLLDRVKERHTLIDRVISGNRTAITRLGEAYHNSADAVRVCAKKGREAEPVEAWDSSSEPDSAGDSGHHNLEDRLRMAAVRWHMIGDHFGVKTPGYVAKEVRGKLAKEQIERAESAARQWIFRFGANVANGGA